MSSNLNILNLLLIFIFSFSLSLAFTFFVKKIAIFLKIVDKPNKERKVHKKDTALLGGVAIFLSFFLICFLLKDKFLVGDLKINHLLGVFIGACFLLLGGILDDKYDLDARYQIIFPILASLAVIAGGVNIEKITNPFGTYIFFNTLQIPILEINGVMHYFVVFSDLLIFIWLMGMMYTTKILDGLDGLVTGIVSIGALIIFLFTISPQYYQPDIAIASLILSGVSLGFLIFNFNPASIFLGESGSLFLGFILGVLAIISGGKIAIALLVMGIPIIDTAWTIIRRLIDGKNPFKGDRRHLHFRLFDLGLGHKKTVLIYYVLSFSFGLSAVFLQSMGKFFALGFLLLIMVGLIFVVNYAKKKLKISNSLKIKN